jgi:hypothetical protein
MPYRLADGYHYFEGTYFLHLQPIEHWNLPTSPHSIPNQKNTITIFTTVTT